MATVESAADQANNTLTTTGNMTTDAASTVTSVAARTGDVVLAVADVTGAAPLASPTFTGTVAGVSGGASGQVPYSNGSGVLAGTPMFRDDANTISQRNGVTPQEFRVYNTYTDASNGEWCRIRYASNQFQVITDSNGTGTARGIGIGVQGTVLVVGGNTVNIYGAAYVCANNAMPAGGTAGLGLNLSSTANFGVFFGSGAPTLSAAQGSLYMRSDGSSTSTRMYVNTNGTTGWTNVTTAA